MYQMLNKTNNDKSLTHEYNVLSNLCNPMKCAKLKNSHYSPILQGCMNTCSGTANFRIFLFLLDNGSSSTMLMGKLTPELKIKNPIEKTTWEIQAGIFTTSKRVNIDFCLP